MKHNNEKNQVENITVDSIYGAFHPIIRTILKFWNRKVTHVYQDPETRATIGRLNDQLAVGNAVVFFDHHYAFDALPVGLTLGDVLYNARKALIPYAVHLDLGVDGTGKPSRRYRVRTKLFQWIIQRIQSSNSNIKIMPVARKFELSNDQMRAMIGEGYKVSNTDYLQTFLQSFQENERGFLCILSPIAGLAFPHKPILHKQLYYLLDNMRNMLPKDVPFYYVSAYPRLKSKWQYYVPMLVRHDFLARGSFNLPKENYDAANHLMKQEVEQLRDTADFQLLDYELIKRK